MLIEGWYFGQDINPNTIAFGEEVLRESGIPSKSRYTLFLLIILTFEGLIDQFKLLF